MKVTIVIPNWNGGKFLRQCLSSLVNQTFTDFETILVDNGSTDDSVLITKKEFPWVQIICLDKNYGFAYAVNRGIENARGEYIALLNNDTFVDQDWLKELVNALDIDPEVSFCSCKMLQFGNKAVIDSVCDVYTLSGQAVKLGYGLRDCGQYDSLKEVFGACAGAAIYRKEFFDKVGLFDESFFCYYEDVDLNLRAAAKGLKCVFVPKAVVYHIGSATTGGRYNKFNLYYTGRNYVLTLKKNLPKSLLLILVPLIFLSNIVLVIKFAFIKISLGKCYLKGLIDGIKADVSVHYTKQLNFYKGLIIMCQGFILTCQFRFSRLKYGLEEKWP
ncbi:glycosyltransferase family 2 protein [Carboxydocella sp. JDF658]|uniref:glycosyltransferase family 2 protein n=1 Tax=Carboxydocella sp. JDF658 TaxID=1926600 RepID=UPI0009AE7C30|nr:glycosyltransferase family 2 protein [Carboxydocella sp. JDF658]GAW31246.1 glycosyl transferase family 2 [Carboxydocella sp. JDF658]